VQYKGKFNAPKLNAAALSAFHVSTAPNTGLNTRQGAERRGNNQRMVRPTGEISNSLFEELADWEEQLKHSGINFTNEFGGPVL